MSSASTCPVTHIESEGHNLTAKDFVIISQVITVLTILGMCF